MPRLGRTHGTRSCYAGGCRLQECKEAARAYWRQYNRLLRHCSGHDRMVDPSRAVKHIRWLREQGMGRDYIGRAAGMTKAQIFHIDHERQKYILESTERKILAVQLVDSFMVSATGTRRRLQALAVLGYTLAQISTSVDSNSVYLSLITRGKNKYVYRSTAIKIAAAYDRLSMTPGPSVHSKARALAKGWVPPLAWDDDTIDDPNSKPSGVPKATPIIRFDLAEWESLIRGGENVERATERCGSTLTAVERAAWRAGRNDLAALAAHARKRYAA